MKQITIDEEYKKNPGISPDESKKLREWLKTQPEDIDKDPQHYDWVVKLRNILQLQSALAAPNFWMYLGIYLLAIPT